MLVAVYKKLYRTLALLFVLKTLLSPINLHTNAAFTHLSTLWNHGIYENGIKYILSQYWYEAPISIIITMWKRPLAEAEPF